MTKCFDVVIIGAGIIGLSTALAIQEAHPKISLAVLDKESAPGMHQTGRNSGVMHSGIYYKPNSLKAKNCVSGVFALKNFCQHDNIPFEECGKVIVATKKEELPILDLLEKRGRENCIEGLKRIGKERLKEIEPNAAGIEALYSPKTAIVCFTTVAKRYAEIFSKNDGTLLLSHPVTRLERKGDLCIAHTNHQGEVAAKFVINCSGVYADRLAHTLDREIIPKQIIPFRGEYYDLIPEKQKLIKGLIYPVPNPAFPFLGVHVTRMIDGTVEAGPNAVLAFNREGYRKRDFSLHSLVDYLTYSGFWKMAQKHYSFGFSEFWRSMNKHAFIRSVQTLVPCLTLSDFVKGRSGIRSQLVLRNGTLADDFVIVKKKRALHLLSAPSPGATASLSIGRYLAKEYEVMR